MLLRTSTSGPLMKETLLNHKEKGRVFKNAQKTSFEFFVRLQWEPGINGSPRPQCHFFKDRDPVCVLNICIYSL